MKFKLLILATLILIGLVGFYAYNASRKQVHIFSPITGDAADKISESPADKSQPRSAKTVLYQDPAGFKFSYPEDLKISAIDKNDPDYFSALKLTNGRLKENLTIDVTSTKYTSIENWVKNNQQLTGNSRDIKMAGLKAKQINSKGTITIIAVDTEALITLTANFAENNRPYWENTVDKIVSTFAFELPDSSRDAKVENESPASSGEDIVFEGEEVIE